MFEPTALNLVDTLTVLNLTDTPVSSGSGSTPGTGSGSGTGSSGTGSGTSTSLHELSMIASGPGDQTFALPAGVTFVAVYWNGVRLPAAALVVGSASVTVSSAFVTGIEAGDQFIAVYAL